MTDVSLRRALLHFCTNVVAYKDEIATQTQIRDRDDRFVRSWTGMTQLDKFRDRPCTLLIFLLSAYDFLPELIQ
jgi:hypothetical protein